MTDNAHAKFSDQDFQGFVLDRHTYAHVASGHCQA